MEKIVNKKNVPQEKSCLKMDRVKLVQITLNTMKVITDNVSSKSVLIDKRLQPMLFAKIVMIIRELRVKMVKLVHLILVMRGKNF